MKDLCQNCGKRRKLQLLRVGAGIRCCRKCEKGIVAMFKRRQEEHEAMVLEAYKKRYPEPTVGEVAQ